MEIQNRGNRHYIAPVIERLILDNEVSLILESAPPDGPNELISGAPEYFSNKSFELTVSCFTVCNINL